jgi:hypothetical protein
MLQKYGHHDAKGLGFMNPNPPQPLPSNHCNSGSTQMQPNLPPKAHMKPVCFQGGSGATTDEGVSWIMSVLDTIIHPNE